MSTASSQTATPVEPAADGRGWARPLTVFAAVGLLVSVQTLITSWLTVRITVEPGTNETVAHGIGRFGALSVGFGIGLVLLAATLALAMWRPALRRPLSTVALGLSAVLMVVSGFLFARVAEVQETTAATVVRLRNAVDGLPTEVEFHTTAPGLYSGLAAVFLFALVAAQLRWSRHGIAVIAWLGTLTATVSIALPWTRVWLIDDATAEPYASRSFTLWSIGFEGYAILAELLVLLLLVYATMQAPGYARARWALGAVLLGALLVLSVQVREVNAKQDAFALQHQVSDVIGVSTTGAGPLLAVAAALLIVAAFRSWWHGREEIPPADGDAGWRPARASSS